MNINDPRLRPPLPRRVVQPQIATIDKISGSPGTGEITVPGPRPWTFQTAINFQLTIPADVPTALSSGQFAADAMIIDVPAATGNSIFFGYGSQISVTSGIEIRPGLPLVLSADDQREQWELQRPLEVLASFISRSFLGQYRANRVVFDAGQYYVVATVQTVVAVMLFPPNDN